MSQPEVSAQEDSSMRSRVFAELNPSSRSSGLSRTNAILVALILSAVAVAVLETEPVLSARFGSEFAFIELLLGTLFLAEYVVRLWVAPEGAPRLTSWRARLRFVLSPAGIADLIAVSASLASLAGGGALLLRLLRLMRILRLAKLGRMSTAMQNIGAAVSARREELAVSAAAGLVVMLVAATLLHFAEGNVQPEAFGSIPRALWWSVATLTTIGYGDVYPVTATGKLLAAITALSSIGVIAMPAGILAAAFSDAFRQRRGGTGG